MFIDRAEIYIQSGNGGNGAVSFHREKYIAAGGPDGGNGGRGGDIIFEVDTGMTTLANFRYKRKYRAENGANGGQNKMTGKSGNSIVVKVPAGTIVRNADTGHVLADLTKAGEKQVLARGGKGGKGNMNFATPTRQIPAFARLGEPGIELNLVLELKLLADVGLVGFPNVGKSTLLSVTTAARPEIADYHFTTINPNLGVVYTEESGFVMADIPGLIEGAAQGQGLGHRFLRHIERTRLLLHMIDISGKEGRDPFDDFLKINEELRQYDEQLSKRPQIIVANKIDEPDSEKNLEIFKEKFEKWKDEHAEEIAEGIEAGAWKIFEISAPISYKTRELMEYTASVLQKVPEMIIAEDEIKDEVVYTPETDGPLFTVKKASDGAYEIEGSWIRRVLETVNIYEYESQQYFQRLIRKKGLIDELERQGIQEGDTVRIDDFEFEFYD